MSHFDETIKMILSGTSAPQQKVTAVQPMRVDQSPPLSCYRTRECENDVYFPPGCICKRISLNVNGVVKDLIVPVEQGPVLQTTFDSIQSDSNSFLPQNQQRGNIFNSANHPRERFEISMPGIIRDSPTMLRPQILNVNNMITPHSFNTDIMIPPELQKTNTILGTQVNSAKTVLRPHVHSANTLLNNSNFKCLTVSNPGTESGVQNHSLGYQFHVFNQMGNATNSTETESMRHKVSPLENGLTTFSAVPIHPNLPSREGLLLPHTLTANAPTFDTNGVSSNIPVLYHDPHVHLPQSYTLLQEVPHLNNGQIYNPTIGNTQHTMKSVFAVPSQSSIQSSENVCLSSTIKDHKIYDSGGFMDVKYVEDQAKLPSGNFILSNEDAAKSTLSGPKLNIKAKCTLSTAVHRHLLDDTNAGKIVLVHYKSFGKKENEMFLFQKVGGCLQSSIIQNKDDLKFLGNKRKHVVEYTALHSTMTVGASLDQAFDIHTMKSTAESINEINNSKNKCLLNSGMNYCLDKLDTISGANVNATVKTEDLSEIIKIKDVTSISESRDKESLDDNVIKEKKNENNTDELYSENIMRNKRKYTRTMGIHDNPLSNIISETCVNSCNLRKNETQDKRTNYGGFSSRKHHLEKIKEPKKKGNKTSGTNTKMLTKCPKVKECSVVIQRVNIDYERYRNTCKLHIAKKCTKKLPNASGSDSKIHAESVYENSKFQSLCEDVSENTIIPLVVGSNVSLETGTSESFQVPTGTGTSGPFHIPIDNKNKYIMIKTLAGTFLVPTHKEDFDTSIVHSSNVDINNNNIQIESTFEENRSPSKNEHAVALQNCDYQFNSFMKEMQEKKKESTKRRIERLKEKQKLQHLATQEAKKTLDSLKYTLQSVVSE